MISPPNSTAQRLDPPSRLVLHRFGALVGLALLATLVATSLGCGGAQGSLGPVRYGRTAKVSYDRGVAELERKSADRARQYFKQVRRAFPYSRYAALAELRLADCDFVDEAYSEAAASYRRFLRLHPTHPDVDHAAFRRGLSFHKMVPTDWFLVPASYERDMSATRDALRELRAFLRQFPESDYAEEAEELARDCLTRLAAHEMYVARFYLRRGKNLAAIGRTRVVERRYAGSGAVPEAMFLRGETYLHMEDEQGARDTFLDLILHHPRSPEAARAAEYLRHLGVEDVQAALAAREHAEPEEADEEEP